MDASRLWQEQRQLYPVVISRLERASGPDRALDFDIAFVLSLVEDANARNFRPTFVIDQTGIMQFADTPLLASALVASAPGPAPTLAPDLAAEPGLISSAD